MMLWLIVLLIIGARSDDPNFVSEDYNQEHYVEEQDDYSQNNRDNTYSQHAGRNSIKNRGTKISYTDNELIAEKESQVSAIPGDPGKDYPMHDGIPPTSFRCRHRHPGYYADQEANCQVFHVCSPSGHKTSFLCPNGSIFNQRYLVCDWWYDFDCSTAPEFYVTPAPIFNLFRAIPSSANDENYRLLQHLDPGNPGYDLNVAHSGGNTGQTDEFDQLPAAQNNTNRFDQNTDRYHRENLERNAANRDKIERARFNHNNTERNSYSKIEPSNIDRKFDQNNNDRVRYDQSRRVSENRRIGYEENRQNGLNKPMDQHSVPENREQSKTFVKYDQRSLGHGNVYDNYNFEKNNGNEDGRKLSNTESPMILHQYSISADLRNASQDTLNEHKINN